MATRVLVITNNASISVARSEAEIFIGLKQKFGYEVTVITTPNSEYAPRFQAVGIRVIGSHPTKKFSIKQIKSIRAELKAGAYHIVHLFNNRAMINGILASIGVNVKVVIYRGTIGNVHWWDPFAYLKHLSPRVDCIVCNVKEIEESIRKNLFFGRDKVITIAKGHNIDWYNPVQAEDLQKYGVPNEAFKVICVANVRKVKGIHYLLQATHYLKPSSPICLILLGNGMDNPEFSNIIKNSPIQNRIFVLGYQKDPLPFVKACDAFVLASIYGESLTRSVFEAMCMEVAPVISNLPGNAKFIIENETGVTFPTKNPEAIALALTRLSEQKTLAKQLGKNARIHIRETLNSEMSVEQYNLLYQKLAGSL